MYRAKCLCVGCSDPGPQWGHMTHHGWALPGPPQVHLPWVLDSFVITANSETLHPHQIFAAPAVSQSPMRSRPTHENAALRHSVPRVPSSHCSPANCQPPFWSCCSGRLPRCLNPNHLLWNKSSFIFARTGLSPEPNQAAVCQTQRWCLMLMISVELRP